MAERARWPKSRTGGRRVAPLLALLGLLAGFLIAAGLSASAAVSPDAALRQSQAQWLDPQASTETSSMANMPGMTMPVPGTTTAAPAAALPPAVGGMWAKGVPFDAKFNAVHEIPGPNGKILLVAGSGNSTANFAAGTFRSFVWIPDPTGLTGGVRREVPTPKDLFCSGHILLPDGRALVAGGTASYVPFKGQKTLYAFNFATERYDRLPDMKFGRWYNTIVAGSDGRDLIVSGLDENGKITGVAEIFDYRTNLTMALPGPRIFPLYPHIFMDGKGRYFFDGAPGANGKPGFWNPFNNTYQPVTGLAVPAQRIAAASCFVGDVRNQNLMVMGGGWPAVTSTSVINLGAAVPSYHNGPPLRAAKAYLSCVTLPDGNLFEANGGSANTAAGASLEAGLLSNVVGPWAAANPLPVGEQRLYHSLLFLLDDGRIVSMTSNPNGGPRSTSLLVFSPPYLFKGPRPVINAAPAVMARGGTYAVSATATGATVTRVSLTAASAPTHSSAVNQRYESLPYVGGKITIPPSANMLPPGWYRLWAIDSLGRVSVCKWVSIP